jgi:hypothetical protein
LLFFINFVIVLASSLKVGGTITLPVNEIQESSGITTEHSFGSFFMLVL